MSKSSEHVNEQRLSTEDSVLAKPNLKGDWSNLFLLLLLYTIQGVPGGIVSAIPILLQSKKTASYKDQALFSLSAWPFSFKLLWAPLVDALYVQKIGKRKSWLIPVQYVIGAILIFMANNIDDLLPENGKPNVVALACAFFALIFLVATQDVSVDGWALTILKKNNVGYSSACGSLGIAIGSMTGSILPTLFTSEEFCNKYLRTTPHVGGVVTMKSILFFWGIIFMLLTTLIAIFKKEKDNTLEDDHVKLSVVQNYVLLWDILKLPSVQILAIALLTSKIGYAAVDHVSTLKLIDAGVSKDNIMIINTSMCVVNMIVPLVVAKYTSGPKVISLYVNVVPIRLLLNIAYVMLIYYTPKLISHNGVMDIPVYYYTILVFLKIIRQVLAYIMGITMTAFFSRISDPRFGATYMTLMNTLSNLGNMWTSTVALGVIDLLTIKDCSHDFNNNCSTIDLQNICKESKGHCIVTVDGYYEEMTICTIIGIFWYIIFRNILKNLQNKSPSHWLVFVRESSVENDV